VPCALRFAAAERDSYHRLQLQWTFQPVVPWAERDVSVRVEIDDRQRRECHEALLDADGFEDLAGGGGRRRSSGPRSGRRCDWFRRANIGGP